MPGSMDGLKLAHYFSKTLAPRKTDYYLRPSGPTGGDMPVGYVGKPFSL